MWFIVKRFHRINQRGDTIVEVLISIAIISLILGGAYVTTNNSLHAERGSQERTNATKLVESQIEAMKNVALNNPDALFKTAPSTFCVTPGQVVVLSLSTNNTCKFSASGVNNNNKEPNYYISASLTKSNGINTITIKNTWAAIEKGATTDSIQMSYRMYQQ